MPGDVEQLHPLLAGARVAVAPMRAGSGQLLKVLEAMASGTPVVTTGRGLSGIEATPASMLLVADDPAAFAAHVVNVLRDDALAARSGRRAAARGTALHLGALGRALERVYEGARVRRERRQLRVSRSMARASTSSHGRAA